MPIKLANPGKLRRAACFDFLILRDQKPPLLNIIPLNRSIEAVVPHRESPPWLLPRSTNYRTYTIASQRVARMRAPMTASAKQSSFYLRKVDCFVAGAPRNDRSNHLKFLKSDVGSASGRSS